MVSRIRVALGLLVVACGAYGHSLEAGPARPAPPLPAPTGAVVNVSTEPQLQAAVRSLSSNTTIVIAPGTYVLTSTLYFKGRNNVGIRGATANADDVVLVGPGMAQTNYGAVPFGIWTGDGVDGITIANLTIRDLFFHPIIFNAGTENPRVYNVHLINAGEQFIKSNPDDAGGGVDNGIVEYSVIEFTTTAKDDYTKGVDVQTATNWIIRHNLFRNIVAPPGQLAGPAILLWRGTSNSVVDGNQFVNCARGVMFGADDYYSPSHRGGLARNNIVYRSAAQPGDVGIMLTDSPETQVLNNTVYLSGTYASPIEYRYPGTRNVLIANNLLDGVIKARDGGTATLTRNAEGAGAAMFVNAASGDLHLSAAAAAAVDQGVVLASVPDDWDGQARPIGDGYDIGADERGTAATTARIAGRVTTTGGSPLAGATLTLGGGASRSATSDGSGAYSFLSLPGAAYTVTPAMTGFTFTPASRVYPSLDGDQVSADFVATAIAREPAPPSGGTAAFVRTDTTTRGAWAGSYGADGYGLAGGASSYPAYAQVSVAAAATWTWAGSTGDTRALQRPGGPDRVAATWYSGTAFTIDINLTDGQSHQVALYSVDWDPWGRTFRVDVLDAGNDAVLDSRSVSGFQGGQYLVWTLSGHVKLRLTNNGPQNAVASGVFFGSAGAAPAAPGGSTASFKTLDDTTRGTWLGTYGSQGYGIVGVNSSYPAYARVSVMSASSWTWAASTTDVRGLQRPDAGDRLAATWYAAGAFTIDIELTDGQSHQVALYSVDWDGWGRSYTVDVLDGRSGALLDTRTINGFQNGRYLVWTLSGHVQLRLSNTGPQNAVASALFFDPASGAPQAPPPATPASSATFSKVDDTTGGNWVGVYGAQGHALPGDAVKSPGWAQVAVGSASTYIWSLSTSDRRGALRPDGASRLSACWYSGTALTIDVNVTDGGSHSVALYMVDWDPWGRSQRIDVLDAASGAVLDTQTVGNFQGGRYLAWTVTGHVTFRVFNTGHPNAVVNGLFFD